MGMDLPGSTMFGVQLDGDPALAAAQALSHFQQYWTFTNTMARARTVRSDPSSPAVYPPSILHLLVIEAFTLVPIICHLFPII